MNEAMLVIDIQKHFYEGKGKRFMDDAIPHLRRHVRECRNEGIPVIWIQHRNPREGLQEGTEGFEILETMDAKKTEPRVVKTRPNSFYNTGLEKLLDDLNIETLRLGGYKAEGCVRATYAAAKKKGYKVKVIKNGTASTSRLGILIGKLYYGNGE